MKSFFKTGGMLGSLVLAGVVLAGFSTAYAADFTVAPAVIDAHGVPRDIFNYQLTVTNTSGQMQYVYASVHELTQGGAQPFGDPALSDRPALLADWISVSRGVMVFQPGETKTIPVGININPYAVAGDYHAVIAFVAGATLDQAEQHLDGAPQTIINMTVASDAKVALQVDAFGPAKNFYSGFPVTFNYTIENTGDVAATPLGEIRFYDRVGHEIGSVDANPDQVAIGPGKKQDFSATWKDGSGLGQYKAELDMTYGGTGSRLDNIALFWILPWVKIAILFGILLLVVIIAAIWIHREYEKRHHARQELIERLVRTRHVVDLRHPNQHP